MSKDGDDDVPVVVVETDEQFRDAFEFELARMCAKNEKLAADTGETIEFEFGVMREDPLTPGGGEILLKVRMTCEPGKPARRVLVTQPPTSQLKN